MSENLPQKRLCRPVYKTTFQVRQELYESPAAKEPVLSRTYSGRLRIDLLRMLCLGTIALSAVMIAGLLASDR